jgi:sugar phosphate isomerase/epimerase
LQRRHEDNVTQTVWSRRNALKLAVGSGILAALPRQGAQAAPLGLPVGVQLYPVSDELGRDFDGTLRRVAEIGYTIVELPSFYGRKPVDLRRSLDAAGLKCISGGVFANPMGAGEQSLETHAAQIFDDFRALGLTHAVCIMPPLPQRMLGARPASVEEAFASFTADDWREAGAFLNKAGAEAGKAGLQLAYHNHGWEFQPADGAETGFDMLAASTDPSLVQFELDCGWVASQGVDAATTVRKYSQRITLMHIKDIARRPQGGERLRTVAVGKGMIDWPALFKTAEGSRLRQYFVELEPPFDAPAVWQLLRESHDYLQDLKV